MYTILNTKTARYYEYKYTWYILHLVHARYVHIKNEYIAGTHPDKD